MANSSYCVYILHKDLLIVYVGITSNFSQRISQHRERKKIKFDGHKVIIHGCTKEVAEIIEGCLIHFGSVDLGLKLQNKNHNPMYNVWNITTNKELKENG